MPRSRRPAHGHPADRTAPTATEGDAALAPLEGAARRRHILLLGGAGAALIAYNGALNLIPFPAAAYVPANLALTAVAVLAGRRSGLTAEVMGLGLAQGRGLRLGLGIAGGIALGLLVATRVPALAPLLGDERATGLSGAALLYGAAIRIPLGTALPEELIFRGVLLAACRRVARTWWGAAAAASAVFGLWHIGPTIVLARVNGLDTSPAATAAVVGVAVVLTTVAGLGFSLLRRWGGGIAAPVLVHTATNTGSLLVAVAAQRMGG